MASGILSAHRQPLSSGRPTRQRPTKSRDGLPKPAVVPVSSRAAAGALLPPSGSTPDWCPACPARPIYLNGILREAPRF